MKLAPHWKGWYQVVQVLVSGGEAALTYRIVHSQTFSATPFSVMSPVASHFQHFVMIRFLFHKKKSFLLVRF